MASFAEVAAQMPVAGESMECMSTNSSIFPQNSSDTFAATGSYDETAMQTEDSQSLAQATMTSPDSPSSTGSGDALSALAALATSAAMQGHEHQQHHHHQVQEENNPDCSVINAITPHQTSSSDDDSEAMPPPPPRVPTVMPPAPLQALPPANSSDGFTSILAFQNNDTNTLFSTSPRRGGRLRSVSNPEGMEKWDSYTRRNDRLHFVLPSSILEEELASTKRVLEEKKMEEDYVRGYVKRGAAFSASPFGAMMEFSPDHQNPATDSATNDNDIGMSTTTARRSKRQHKPKNIFGTSPDSVSSDISPPASTSSKSKKKTERPSSTASSSSSSSANNHNSNNAGVVETIIDEDEEEIDESLLEPEELLRRARSRLLEDLSEGGEDGVNGGVGGLNGDKSVLSLPHSLAKYKEVYNKNGRIGIYTPAERAAIIQKFNAKRARRVWNKKIRYNCRKNLADRRMRVKGRFVKRAVEAANSPPSNSPPPTEDENATASATEITAKEEKIPRSKNSSPPTSGSPLTTVNEGEERDDDNDEAMPDVNDEEAGFNPTDEMPYRRTRRYTIT
ncbi:hypothetical protein ACHAWC_003484 [Mediolabrus comicus]